MASANTDQFCEIPPYGPFGELTGPIFGCVKEGVPIIRLQMEAKHLNRGNNMHGGMVATLADNAMIWGIRQIKPESGPFVTTHLAIDYIGRIGTGDWLEAHVSFIKTGKKLNFAECFIYIDDRVVARANGQFMVVQT